MGEITLRDFFAGLWMAAKIISVKREINEIPLFTSNTEFGSDLQGDAHKAYRVADAMLTASKEDPRAESRAESKRPQDGVFLTNEDWAHFKTVYEDMVSCANVLTAAGDRALSAVTGTPRHLQALLKEDVK